MPLLGADRYGLRVLDLPHRPRVVVAGSLRSRAAGQDLDELLEAATTNIRGNHEPNKILTIVSKVCGLLQAPGSGKPRKLSASDDSSWLTGEQIVTSGGLR
jgi:hypothetical protein